MAKATIKSKTGATITVEGTKEEVAKILSDFERTATIGYVKESISRKKIRKREEKKRKAASDLIVELKEEGYFDRPKSLTDIAQVLENRGYLYPTTTLSGVALGLVKKKLLSRKKIDGKWVYGK